MDKEALTCARNNILGYTFTHNKTGNKYVVNEILINCTNEQNGQIMVKYSPLETNKYSTAPSFVREVNEFMQKFTNVSKMNISTDIK